MEIFKERGLLRVREGARRTSGEEERVIDSIPAREEG